MLVQHPCRACGRVGDVLGRRWGAGQEPLQLGGVLYSALDHACACGLSLPIFVVLNDLLREAGHAVESATDALAAAEALMPPRDLERGLTLFSVLLHREDDAEAMVLAEALAERYPDRPECHFNAGCARQRTGDVAEALAHYERALELHPQLSAAWNNRSMLLRQVGRLQEARFCLSRARQATGEVPPPDPRTRVLAEVPGRFGALRVVEDEDLRALFIGSQCQGAVLRVTDDEGPTPGPFAHSPFTTGWLLAGCRHPRGRGLMLGLGSGAGAVTLLSNFPELTLRVVEIDERLIELALGHYPRLARLHRQRRLEIVNADARDVVGDASEHFDFALLDAFTGEPGPPALLTAPGFLADLAARATTLLANAIFTLGDEAQDAWISTFGRARRPVVALYPTGAPEQWSQRPHNWILSTARITPPRSFEPFAGSSHYVAKAIRNDFASMVTRAIVVPADTLGCLDPSTSAPALEAWGEASASL